MASESLMFELRLRRSCSGGVRFTALAVLAGLALGVALGVLLSRGGQSEAPPPAATVASPTPQTSPVEPPPAPREFRATPPSIDSPNAAPATLTPAGRSPMPEPGEEFTSPLPFAKVQGSDEPNGQGPPSQHVEGVVPWERAREYAGQTIDVQGRVVDTHNTGGVCFLNFVQGDPQSFYIIIFQDALDSWPQPPQVYFLNKTIRVTGEVRQHRGRPQIQVRRGDQIQVVE